MLLLNKVTCRATHCIVWSWAYDEGSLLGVCSTTLTLARLSARSCSAVKECPQVLHLHFAFGLIRLPVPNPLFSLGRNAMTNSPPHSRHCRLAMVTLFPRRLGLISKLESPVQNAFPKFWRKRILLVILCRNWGFRSRAPQQECLSASSVLSRPIVQLSVPTLGLEAQREVDGV